MDKLKVFIIYHKNVQPDKIFLNHYTENYIKENFIFLGVNELHFKNIVNNKNYENVMEYNLPIYNPFLQKRGYMETSVYLHVYWNKLYKNLTHIGFFNYDMVHNDNIPKVMEDNTIYIYDMGKHIVSNNTWHKMMCPSLRNLQFLIDSYNKHFKTNYKKSDLNNQRLCLGQTHIYPIKIYEKLCGWLEVLCDEIYPWSIQLPWETHWGVMGGFTERAMAIFNSIEFLNGIKWKSLSLDNRRILGEEKIHYSHHHWINQFDLNIHTKFEKIVPKKTIHLSNLKLITENMQKTDDYLIKEHINRITHIYKINNKEKTKSKSIMFYLPEDCNLFKKRYLALQDNLENCNIYNNDTEIIFEKDEMCIIFSLHICT